MLCCSVTTLILRCSGRLPSAASPLLASRRSRCKLGPTSTIMVPGADFFFLLELLAAGMLRPAERTWISSWICSESVSRQRSANVSIQSHPAIPREEKKKKAITRQAILESVSRTGWSSVGCAPSLSTPLQTSHAREGKLELGLGLDVELRRDSARVRDRWALCVGARGEEGLLFGVWLFTSRCC